MPNLKDLRDSIVFSDAAANTKIIGEYTVLNKSGFIHSVTALRSCPERTEDTIHFYRFEKKHGEPVWVQTSSEAEKLPGRIVFPSLKPDHLKKYE
jgi:hypothetical protein